MSEITAYVVKLTDDLRALAVVADKTTEALKDTADARNVAGIAGSGTVTGGSGNTGGVGSSSSMAAVIAELKTISGRG